MFMPYPSGALRPGLLAFQKKSRQRHHRCADAPNGFNQRPDQQGKCSLRDCRKCGPTDHGVRQVLLNVDAWQLVLVDARQTVTSMRPL